MNEEEKLRLVYLESKVNYLENELTKVQKVAGDTRNFSDSQEMRLRAVEYQVAGPTPKPPRYIGG